MAACEGICENSFCSCDQSNIPNPEHISYKEENMAAARNENIQSKNLNLGGHNCGQSPPGFPRGIIRKRIFSENEKR